MDIEGIRQALRREPFVPFSMRLADGRALPVRHPEFVAIGGTRVIVTQSDGTWDVVEPFQVVSMDYPEEKARVADHWEECFGEL